MILGDHHFIRPAYWLGFVKPKLNLSLRRAACKTNAQKSFIFITISFNLFDATFYGSIFIERGTTVILWTFLCILHARSLLVEIEWLSKCGRIILVWQKWFSRTHAQLSTFTCLFKISARLGPIFLIAHTVAEGGCICRIEGEKERVFRSFWQSRILLRYILRVLGSCINCAQSLLRRRILLVLKWHVA